MKLPFIFVSLRSVVRELRGIHSEAKRIADALDRAWPNVEISVGQPEDGDFLGPLDHMPDSDAAKKQILKALAQGDESLAEEIMARFDSES